MPVLYHYNGAGPLLYASVGSLIGVALSPQGIGHHALTYAAVGGIVGVLTAHDDDRVANGFLGSIIGTVIGSLLDNDHQGKLADQGAR